MEQSGPVLAGPEDGFLLITAGGDAIDFDGDSMRRGRAIRRVDQKFN
jgi:hypothetical protein